MTTKNTIKKLALEVANDFNEAQDILSLGETTTAKIDAYDAYNTRLQTGNEFLGTYIVMVERKDDYNRFLVMVGREKCYTSKIDEIRNAYYNNELTYDEFEQKANELANCKCSRCSFDIDTLTMEAWKTGILKERTYIENQYFQGWKEKEIRLNKALQKAGFSQTLIDFYSAQVKTEKEVYLTISDRVQHIAGCSAYAKSGTWSGYNGTSCQDTRHDSSMAYNLAGSLHDDRLYIAMLHYNLEDLEDMQDNLKARCMMRLQHFNDEAFLIGCKLYGNNESKGLLKVALNQLEEYRIYPEWAMEEEEQGGDVIVYHREDANGSYELIANIEEEVYVNETIEEEVDITCPMCSGSGNYEVSVHVNDYDTIEREIDCPMCSGHGTYSTYIYEEIEHYETVEVEEHIGDFTPYDGEGYDHYTSYTKMYLNVSKLERDAIKYGRKLV